MGKSRLEQISAKEIESVTRKARRKRAVPLVVSKAPRIAFDEDLNAKIEVLSSVEGVSADTFVKRLIKSDINRLWKKYKKVG